VSGGKLASASPDAFAALLIEAAACPSGEAILGECMRLAGFLLAKNKAYGDAALKPLGVFARGLPAETAIRVRLDDKLSRLMRGESAGEDVEADLLGYLVLLRVARAQGSQP